MEINTKEIGIKTIEMEKVNLLGKMVIIRMESGKIIKIMVKQYIIEIMEIYIIEFFIKIKFKGLVNIQQKMDVFMKDIGRIIKEMDKVKV